MTDTSRTWNRLQSRMRRFTIATIHYCDDSLFIRQVSYDVRELFSVSTYLRKVWNTLKQF